MRNALITLFLLVAFYGNADAFQRVANTQSSLTDKKPSGGDTLFYNPVYALFYLYLVANPDNYPETAPPLIQNKLNEQLGELNRDKPAYLIFPDVPQIICPECTSGCTKLCCKTCPCTLFKEDNSRGSNYRFITPQKGAIRLTFSTTTGKKIPMTRDVMKFGKRKYCLYTLELKKLSGKQQVSFRLSSAAKRLVKSKEKRQALEVTLDEKFILSIDPIKKPARQSLSK